MDRLEYYSSLGAVATVKLMTEDRGRLGGLGISWGGRETGEYAFMLGGEISVVSE